MGNCQIKFGSLSLNYSKLFSDKLFPFLTVICREEKERNNIKEKRIDAILLSSDDLEKTIQKQKEKLGGLQIELNIKEGEAQNYKRKIEELKNMEPGKVILNIRKLLAGESLGGNSTVNCPKEVLDLYEEVFQTMSDVVKKKKNYVTSISIEDN